MNSRIRPDPLRLTVGKAEDKIETLRYWWTAPMKLNRLGWHAVSMSIPRRTIGGPAFSSHAVLAELMIKEGGTEALQQ